MADVAELFFLPVDDEDETSTSPIDGYTDYIEDEDDDEREAYYPQTLDTASASSPFWSFAASSEGAAPFPFPEDLDSCDDDADADASMGSDYLGLDDHAHEFAAEEEDDDDDVQDLFFLQRSSLPQPIGDCSPVAAGLRVAGFGSDSGSDDDGYQIARDSEVNGTAVEDVEDGRDLVVRSLCWDCLRIEEDTGAEDFEWEEVDGRVDERDNLSMMVRAEEEEEEEEEGTWVSGSRSPHQIAGGAIISDIIGSNSRWQLLMESPFYSDDEHEEDMVNTSDYEILFEQFIDQIQPMGSPPAAKSVVESLPSVLITEQDVANSKNNICAVCKDEISLEEKVRRLPCSHHYHGDCILPWLAIRNTCPVCRYELPTDDPEYESWRARRANGAAAP